MTGLFWQDEPARQDVFIFAAATIAAARVCFASPPPPAKSRRSCSAVEGCTWPLKTLKPHAGAGPGWVKRSQMSTSGGASEGLLGYTAGPKGPKLCIGAAEGQAREGASNRRWLALPLVGRPILTMLPGRATTSSA